MVYAISVVALISSAAIDVVERRLPNVLTLGTATLTLVALPAISIVTGAGSPVRAIAGGAIFGGWILLGAFLVRDGYGLGDVKLAAACGILAGWLSWSALAVAVLVTQASILVLIFAARTRNRQSASLGPAFVIGVLAAVWLV
jgi:leader peptidase (prepilin peptidase)/N-methyltransferase